ncbi:hypothetical protein Belba_3419 [Belliella baltica DSM 15883]|uniref:Uncharacterized protein n=1 Tax=Belliella baltica (strain DSM 15883 / CIP 108006 / LMG 21964 / BA134) TaxID=866536 RepID=I3Z9K3_BELBD|nr:hypothetical protein [Belliella baltica]AFL85921.1 hypothetical protein Belba_3419 [Belliella baltica DSM 15883]
MGSNNIFKLFLLVFILVYFGACTSEKSSEENISETNSISAAEEEKQLLEIGIQQLSSWSSHWKSNAPDFNLQGFVYSRTDSLEQIQRPEEIHIGSESPFFPFLKKHPEGDGVVDIYSYKVVFPETGEPYFNPDAEVTYYKSDGMRERLLFMGPSGVFEDAVWLSSEALLVVGHFESENGVSPKVWIIYPKSGVVSQYDNPLHTKSYIRESFLIKRFSSLETTDGV